ncbi:Pentafunctional AroM protein [Ramicandelaber brevisporus]|nr:Pentafunctional AroM protein [Ramicandelaber brevisporus]
MSTVTRISILGEESIVVGFGLTSALWTDLVANLKCSTFVVVTDTNIARLYLDSHRDAFNTAIQQQQQQQQQRVSSAPSKFLSYVVPSGEPSKSRATKSDIEDFMLENGCTRDTCVVALGGGVIGDLAGFVAATFMRGVPFVQIPTTLLAMVDSSIGGKTAVDTPHAKNPIGAFWQPKRIFIDLATLRTLPAREFANGMAEVIKTAAISSEQDFRVLEDHAAEVRAAVLSTAEPTDEQKKLLVEVVAASARYKAHVVTTDERETGMRGLLNFGHTVGHAIEGLLTPRALHGECVAVGMVLEAEIARNLGHLSQVAVGRLASCIRQYELPVGLDDARLRDLVGGGDIKCLVADMMAVMRLDKKNVGAQKRMVLLKAIGEPVEQRASNVADNVIEAILSLGVTVHPVPPCSPASQPTVTAATAEKISLADPAVHVITPPGSKSISNRALLLAALGKGTCILRNLLHSDDTRVMVSALQQTGAARFEWRDGGRELIVHGSGGHGLRIPSEPLYLGNAGTAARFLTTFANLLPASPNEQQQQHQQHTIVTGNARMKQRPIEPLVTALRAAGCEIEYVETSGCLPLKVTATQSGFTGGHIALAAKVSSQYVSSVLLCAPYATKADVVLELVGGKVISQPYIDMTIAMMRSFGVEVERLSPTTYRIPRGHYTNPAEYTIESDASSATYPLAFAAITGHSVLVRSIGSASLQGDARFAVDVLRPMGCTVEQTADATFVTGPPGGLLRPLPHVDMEPMTDAFLTASVLAAVAIDPKNPSGENATSITGIANQRVKECNRIAAMVTELSKFGVTASELPDGIKIHGRKRDSLIPPPDGVHCYDDHRVAMSFSILGCAVPSSNGTRLQERRCVEKTWPQWWDALEHSLGGRVSGFDIHAQQSAHVAASSADKEGAVNKSVVVIGMRGAGKSTLGRAGAAGLGWGCIDLDAHMEQTLGRTIPDIVNKDGWEAFRAHEARILADVLASPQYSTSHVIVCGGGVVETPDNRTVLANYTASGGVVLQVIQDLDSIISYLATDTSRPMFGQDMRAVWERRKPWYDSLSNAEFIIDSSSNISWATIESDFARLLEIVTGTRRPINTRSFVSLTWPDPSAISSSILAEVCRGSDAVELRVDLLARPRDAGFVNRQILAIRRATTLPIIYTVRTAAQGGRWPDADAGAEMFASLRSGIRWGCEYVDVEVGHDVVQTSQVASARIHGVTSILASWHDPSGKMAWGGERCVDIFERARRIGDVVKIVSVAKTIQDNFALSEYVSRCRERYPLIPFIALNMGNAGRLSRVMCEFFTPVTHPLLGVAAAPGQMNVDDIARTRTSIGATTKKQFYLLGTPISHSMSPKMHNTWFAQSGLPHEYSLLETATVDSVVEEAVRAPAFGGASVTMPHKIDVMRLCDRITPEAKAIGAVNTLIPVSSPYSPQTQVVGDNTDWIGIARSIDSTLASGSSAASATATSPTSASAVSINDDRSGIAALVIGAGGTSRAALFALHRLGYSPIILFNRTPSRAHELAASMRFKVTVVEDLADASAAADGASIGVIVSAIPVDSSSDKPFVYPPSIFASASGDDSDTLPVRVAVELAYKPLVTPFITAAESAGWRTVNGLSILHHQGVAQYEAWTGCTARGNPLN